MFAWCLIIWSEWWISKDGSIYSLLVKQKMNFSMKKKERIYIFLSGNNQKMLKMQHYFKLIVLEMRWSYFMTCLGTILLISRQSSFKFGNPLRGMCVIYIQTTWKSHIYCFFYLLTTVLVRFGQKQAGSINCCNLILHNIYKSAILLTIK